MRFLKSSTKEIKKLIAVGGNKQKFDFNLPLADEITIAGKKHEIKIKEDEKQGTYISFKNKKFPVEVLSKNQNRYEILLNGVSYFFTIETPTSFKRLKYLESTAKTKKSEIVTAPMPGKIVEVLTEEGRDVRVGEPLLILEAMKMQNEIQAPASGKVKKIHVKPGQILMKDDAMIEILIGK